MWGGYISSLPTGLHSAAEIVYLIIQHVDKLAALRYYRR